jgi:hypothetical protein
MERRTAIKNLLVFCGTVWVMPACLADGVHQSEYFGVSWISDDDVNMLSEVVETIIPETDTPGAKKLGVHLFVLTMIKDCATKRKQESFIKGLKELDSKMLKLYEVSFLKATSKQRQQALSEIVADASPDFKFFRAEVRRLTILGYNTSEYVMTNLVPYKLVPGHFYGSVRVS